MNIYNVENEDNNFIAYIVWITGIKELLIIMSFNISSPTVIYVEISYLLFLAFPLVRAFVSHHKQHFG